MGKSCKMLDNALHIDQSHICHTEFFYYRSHTSNASTRAFATTIIIDCIPDCRVWPQLTETPSKVKDHK